jgi:formate C-acetyltransferase
VTVFDSLAIIRQFVYEEMRISMRTLADALAANWDGYEELLAEIKKRGCYFGNDDDISNGCVKRFADSVSAYFADKTSDLGYHFLLGNLIGYNQHHTFFGNALMATPDGRHAGEPISYGICQGGDRDREGLTALLSAIAKANQNTIFCGSTVTNILFDEKLIKDDAHFEKTVTMMESYFRLGGLHFQLNYVSREMLIDAQKNPEAHKTLRVRVSGFSDYFNYLNTDLQNEIVKRTEVKG